MKKDSPRQTRKFGNSRNEQSIQKTYPGKGKATKQEGVQAGPLLLRLRR